MIFSYLISALISFVLVGTNTAHLVDNSARENFYGIYLTSETTTIAKGAKLLDDFKSVGGNHIVINIQTSSGRLAYPSKLPTSLEIGNSGKYIPDLPALVKSLHEKGYYVATRFVLFKNPYLAEKKPEWTLTKKGTSSPYSNADGPVWLDPGNPELRNYLILTAAEIALSGVDEVQFDYVRFPEGSGSGRTEYSFVGDKLFTRDQTITKFVSLASSVLHLLDVRLSVDIFGINVWDNISWKIVGQNISELAKIVDVISPMPYPSHFGPGWGYHKNPADEPYFFVYETTKKFIEQTQETNVEIRPWLQGFVYRVTNFNSKYMREQVRAVKDLGLNGFTVWNPKNNYDYTFEALSSGSTTLPLIKNGETVPAPL